MSQCPLSPNFLDYESNSFEAHDGKFQKNGVSWCPLSPNSEDYESSSDEKYDVDFQKYGVSWCPVSPNSKDYESSSDEEWDDEFQKIGVPQCPLSPNSANYESNSYEERDDEFQKNGVSLCPLSPNSKDYESSSDEEQDESSSDDPMMEMLQRNIVSRSRSRPFRINANYSSYTRGRAQYLTRRSSISALISSECCQKNPLKRMDFTFALESKKRYLSMNKSMQNSYLVGCI